MVERETKKQRHTRGVSRARNRRKQRSRLFRIIGVGTVIGFLVGSAVFLSTYLSAPEPMQSELGQTVLGETMAQYEKSGEE